MIWDAFKLSFLIVSVATLVVAALKFRKIKSKPLRTRFIPI